MSGKPGRVTVLGLDVTFRQEANLERIQNAAAFLEERYSDRKNGMYGVQGRDNLLVLIALELADELLQLEKAQEETRKRVLCLLEKIRKSR